MLAMHNMTTNIFLFLSEQEVHITDLKVSSITYSYLQQDTSF